MKRTIIILRPWQESDAEALFRYVSDPDAVVRLLRGQSCFGKSHGRNAVLLVKVKYPLPGVVSVVKDSAPKFEVGQQQRNLSALDTMS